MGYSWKVYDGRKGSPMGYIGEYWTRESAQAARSNLCRMGGYIVRRSGAKTTQQRATPSACRPGDIQTYDE